MTTLVALPTRDAVVMGCDSLATVSRPMVDPNLILGKYFDSKSGRLRVDESGEPVLREPSQVFDIADSVPFDHMTDVDKLFPLNPLSLGVMFTGITAIGDRTIKDLLREFKEKDGAFKKGSKNHSVKSVGQRLLSHLKKYYDEYFEDWHPVSRPHLELILAGYSKTGRHPQVVKLNPREGQVELQDPPFWPVFGGQSREIERIVYGLDMLAYVQIEERHHETMQQYARRALQAHGIEEAEIPVPTKQERIFAEEFSIPGIRAMWSNFSEQNAIDCVGFFIRIMSQAQRFSSRMPTVGGAIHVALVDRESGFRFISRREYSYDGHIVKRI